MIETELRIDGIHCGSCVSKIEAIAGTMPSIEFIEVDFANKTARVKHQNPSDLEDVAREITKRGFAIRDGAQASSRREIARIGVAAACTGQIMILAVALYAGADGPLKLAFQWLSAALIVPVLAFSALPFFLGATRSIQARQISIDIPIALGILTATSASFWNLLAGSEHFYFDSISALVFLLLSSRYLLAHGQEKARATIRANLTIAPRKARLVSGNDVEIIDHDIVTTGNVIRYLAGEEIGFDGTIVRGSCDIDSSIISGESRPERKNEGDPVLAGMINRNGNVDVQVVAVKKDTRIARIENAVRSALNSRPKIAGFADRVAQYFVAAVVIVFPLVFLFFSFRGTQSAFETALALVLVSCPCAFALATPLAFKIGMSRLASRGIFVRDACALETIARAKVVFLDKTGTLTQGKFTVEKWSSLDHEATRATLALEALSSHAVGHALNEHLSVFRASPNRVVNFVETPGVGISGSVDGKFYEIRRNDSGDETSIVVKRNGAVAATAQLRDSLRIESKFVVDELRSMGLKVKILTGDTEASALRIGRELGIAESDTIPCASPEQKAKIVASAPLSVMIGDGYNDALAFAKASVGVALHREIEICLKAAQVAIHEGGIKRVLELFEAAHLTMKTVRRGFLISVGYNILGIGLALTGILGPLLAAVLMPLSAFTVITLALLSGQGARSKLKTVSG